jgi:hypothetical protein
MTMTDDVLLTAMGTCYACGSLFRFDPDEVPSIVIDGKTGQPASKGIRASDGATAGLATGDARTREPVCDDCADRAEEVRAQQYLPPLWPRRLAARQLAAAAPIQIEDVGVSMGTVMVLVVDVDRVRLVRIKATELSAWRDLVGGNLEACHPAPVAEIGGWFMYLNEDGERLGLGYNLRANILAQAGGWRGFPGDVLVGPVVFVGMIDGSSEEHDVPAALVELGLSLGLWVE